MNRNSIDKKYQWDLSKIYSSILEFRNDIDFVKNKLGEFSKFNGIKYDENNLYEVIELCMNVSRKLEKLSVYTSLLCDEDTSINKNQELKEEVNNLCSEYTKSTYFVDTDILKLDYSYIESLYEKNSKLKEYEIYLKEMFRYKDHMLSSEGEKLLADLSLTFGNNYDTYELLKDNDLEFPSFSVLDTVYELDNNKYSLYMEDDNREVRENAFKTLYGVYRQFKNVFASLITSNIKEEVSLAKIKKYNSSLEASVYHDELDVSVYNNLISTINDRIDVLHKYYELKKNVLKLDSLHLYDVYANLINYDILSIILMKDIKLLEKLLVF